MESGCCTGGRGHGVPFCIKAEFVKEDSPLRGQVVYSIPIEVGAKGPFAKIFQTAALQALQPIVQPVQPTLAIVETREFKSTKPTANYEGADQMVELLNNLNLSSYVPLFLQQEIDLQAFLQLSDRDLIEMNITKMGPRVKILKEINRVREQLNQHQNSIQVLPEPPALPPPTPKLLAPSTPSLPSTPMAIEDTWSMPVLPSPAPSPLPPPVDYGMDDVPVTQPAKRRRIDSAPSTPVPPSPVPQSPAQSFIVPQSPVPQSPVPIQNCEKGDQAQGIIYVYLSNIVAGKKALKKTLFFVKSKKSKQETEATVDTIQSEVVDKLKERSKRLQKHKLQLMCVFFPDKNGDWIAKNHTETNSLIWSFKSGDLIRIDNKHCVNIKIVTKHFVIGGDTAVTSPYIELPRSAKKYPVLYPGSSLEIAVNDETREARVFMGNSTEEVEEVIFGITQNGELLSLECQQQIAEACLFYFKRGKTLMKKVDSLDDLIQKEIRSWMYC